MSIVPFSVVIDDDYTAPAGHLSPAQYVTYVMNMAARSYQSQYKSASALDGIDAACAAYNVALPPEPTPDTPAEGAE